jgi:diguanylate cyclase (GGDEF)-like protein/PAS domain S-box-containing protein
VTLWCDAKDDRLKTPMLTHSVENRFIAIILATLVLAVAPLFILFFELSAERAATDTAERAQLMIEANANALAKPLWDYDAESVAQIAKAMASARSVARIAVRDTSGHVSIVIPENAELGDHTIFTLTQPITYRAIEGLKTVGKIDMDFHHRSMFEGGIYGSWTIIAIFLLAVVIVFSTAVIGNRQLVMKPLSKLTLAIEATRQMGSRHRVDWVSDDEMGKLAASFNEMQDKLAREEAEIRLAHQRKADIYNRTPAMLYSVDAADRLVAVSDYWVLATGYGRDRVLGREFASHVVEADRRTYHERATSAKGVTVRFRRADGECIDVLIRETCTGAGDGDTSLSVMTDVTELKAAEQRNHIQAITDHLTGLLNRQGFEHALGHKIDAADRDGSALACLFVDLDRFKWTNDTLGHAVGDKVLQQVVARIRTQLRPVDTVARLGGDEFAILIAASTAEQTGVDVSHRISRVIDEPFDIDGHAIHLSASIGIALYPAHARTAAELLQNSDLAMYAQKRNGKNGARLFDPALVEDALERATMEADIEAALAGDWFDAYLQPILNLSTGRIAGFEALMRMIHPEKGIVAPSRIVQNAEETGAIIRIGERIFERAVAHLARFAHHPDLRDAYVSVNFSPLQFEWALLDRMTAILLRAGVSPRNIVIEITEAVLMHHNPVIEDVLRAFSEAGYRLALDDFGTGYSSLSYLHRFPVDIVKIDQSFTRSLTDEDPVARRKSLMLVEGIATISHQMKCVVVAEGVESEEQRVILAKMGIDAGQGYLFSRPQPVDRIVAMFAAEDRKFGG